MLLITQMEEFSTYSVQKVGYSAPITPINSPSTPKVHDVYPNKNK